MTRLTASIVESRCWRFESVLYMAASTGYRCDPTESSRAISEDLLPSLRRYRVRIDGVFTHVVAFETLS
ncbi:MAG TPA: hypothetical protein EYN40_03020 [Planctomycetes bacterium]|nr:hypothetical protein [Planctomycetota bacterium]